MKIDIAEGRHRDSKVWKNKSVSWDWFKEKCSEPFRTSETIKEYLAETPARQGEIKDCCGAFVGAHVSNQSRSKKNILYRSMLTLDADFATPYFWEDFQMMYDCAALVYSTHKHTAKKPRMRLCIPFNREVTVAEYEPIARRVAQVVGIEQIDVTSYDLNRLMYYPSAAIDGDFVYEFQDGDFLDPDQVLASYQDYNDIASWPISSMETKSLRSTLLKLGDPTEKQNIVGQFCRTYPDIAEVIEDILPDIYEKTDVEGRYTFIGATGSHGLVVYDNGLYVHSKHGSDPAAGPHCHNAFDIVRIHRFGHLDGDVVDGTNSTKTPSYKAMEEYARKDKNVRKLIFEENSVKSDFDDEDYEPGEDQDQETDDAWKAELEPVPRKAGYLPTSRNVDIILQNDPKLKGKIKYNEFSNKIDVVGKLPWDKSGKRRGWEDGDMAGLRNYFGREPFEIKAGDVIKDSLFLYAKKNSYHPIKEYLNALTWDGIPRVNTLLHDYLGAEDNELNAAFIRKTLCAAVARIFNPGCKFDYVIVLTGPEGRGKSTLFKKLGQEWFSDSFNFGMLSNGVKAIENIQNRWIIEIPELAGLKKAEVEAAKSFITSREDYFRRTYGENMSTVARQCIFAGTSNKPDFLISKTGDRRFWPVDIGVTKPKKFLGVEPEEGLTKDDVAQIWAETVHLWREGEKLYLSSDLEIQAKYQQLQHSEADDREDIIEQYMNMPVPLNWYDKDIVDRRVFVQYGGKSEDQGLMIRNTISASEIWAECIGANVKEMNPHNTRFIHDFLRKHSEWEQTKSKGTIRGYGRVRTYIRKGTIGATRVVEKAYGSGFGSDLNN